MKFHDFSPFYRSGEGIRSKVSGDRLIDNPAVADAQGGSGASFNFDGVDDEVVVGTSSVPSPLKFGTEDFSAEVWIKTSSDTQQFILITWGNASGVGHSWRVTTAGLLYYKLNDGTDLAHIYSTSVVDDGEWHHALFVADRSSNNGQIYIDGVANGAAVDISAVGSVHNVSPPGGDGGELHIGFSAADVYPFDGQISQVRLHNRALSAAEVRAAYNGQAVPYEYVGGSQTNLVYNTFTNDVFSNGWAAQGATITYDAGNDRVNFTNASGTSSGYHGMYWTFGSAPESGKKYRYSYTVVNHTEGTHAISIGNGTWSPAATGNGTFTGVIESSSSPDVYIRLYPQTAGTDNSFGINSVSVTQIGCVAEYLPSGINSTRWMDTSGNGLHGTTSTATAVNHKIGSLTLATLSTDAVTFDSASGTTTSSTLDHFEQGTWAPVLSDGTNNATMHANNIGTYTRIGSTVFVNAQVMVSSLGSVSGNVRITGLPYQPATTTDVRTYWAAASVTHGWSLAITANQSVGGFIRDNQSYIELRLWDATGGTTELQHSEVTADGELMIHAMYYC